MTPLQNDVLKHYDGGEYAYAKTMPQALSIQDTLLHFCLREAHDAADKDELADMIERAGRQLMDLASALNDED